MISSYELRVVIGDDDDEIQEEVEWINQVLYLVDSIHPEGGY